MQPSFLSSRRLHPLQAGALLLLGFVSACGGLIEREPSSRRDASVDSAKSRDAGLHDAADASDASDARDAADAPDADANAIVFLCGVRTIDPEPGTPEDMLFATPSTLTVAAGGFGLVQLTATGPWAEDPSNLVTFDSAGGTLATEGAPYIVDYGYIPHLEFRIPSDSVGQSGTVLVCATDGHVVRNLTLHVQVGPCQPETTENACGSFMCGPVTDGCTGTVDCGSCSGATPYCYQGLCIPCEPTACQAGYAFFATGGHCGCLPCSCHIIDNNCECYG